MFRNVLSRSSSFATATRGFASLKTSSLPIKSFTSLPATTTSFSKISSSSSLFTPSSTSTSIVPLRKFSAATATTAKPTTTTNATATTNSATNAAKEPTSFSDIVNQHGGWYPFLGGVAAIAVTKEILVLNEEALMVTNFAAAMFALYLATYDSLPGFLREGMDERLEKYRAAFKLHLIIAKQSVKYYGAHPIDLDMWKAQKFAYNANIRGIASAQSTKAKYTAAQAVLKRLSDIRAREAAERGAKQAAVISGATSEVRSRLASLSDKDKNQILENALDLLSGKVTSIDAAKDPIKRLYLEYVTKQTRA